MSLFTDLLTQPQAQKFYLVEITAWDTVAEEEVVLYFSDQGFTTEPDDTPANQHFEARVNQALNFQRSVFAGGKIGGQSSIDFGEIRLNNTDGGLDYLQDYVIDGRKLVVRLGGRNFGYTDYGVVYNGTAQSMEVGNDEVVVSLRDYSTKFDTTLQASLYGGTGGADGGDDLAGKPKPVCLGECYNVTPVLVDAANLLYQVHDGQIEAVDAVYDNGSALTLTSEYTVDASAGTITLLVNPTGQVTADVRGSKQGGTYVESAADIMRRLVTVHGPLTDPTDLDTASFTALNSANASTLGIYVGSEQATLRDVLDQVANSIGAFYGFDRVGLFSVGVVTAPSGTAVAEFTNDDILSIDPQPTIQPTWRVRLGYKLNFTVQNDGQLAGVVSADPTLYSFLTTQYRYATADDTGVQDVYPLAQDLQIDTLMVDAVEAQAEADRQQALLGVRRRIYTVQVKTQPFVLNLTDVVTLRTDRMGLQAGRDFRVLGLNEVADTSSVELTVWG